MMKAAVMMRKKVNSGRVLFCTLTIVCALLLYLIIKEIKMH